MRSKTTIMRFRQFYSSQGRQILHLEYSLSQKPTSAHISASS
jgi:hypothetical protein